MLHRQLGFQALPLIVVALVLVGVPGAVSFVVFVVLAVSENAYTSDLLNHFWKNFFVHFLFCKVL